MQRYQNSRRNFLSNMSILSAGALLRPSSINLPAITKGDDSDLQKKWESFWVKSSGKKILHSSFTSHNLLNVKGHTYKNGEPIFFPKENIVAQPTWVFWGNNQLKPADVVITLIESASLMKIARLNRFELNALCKASTQFNNDKILTAFCNNVNPFAKKLDSLKNKTAITKNSQTQQVSYYKERSLIFHKKFIYHS